MADLYSPAYIMTHPHEYVQVLIGWNPNGAASTQLYSECYDTGTIDPLVYDGASIKVYSSGDECVYVTDHLTKCDRGWVCRINYLKQIRLMHRNHLDSLQDQLDTLNRIFGRIGVENLLSVSREQAGQLSKLLYGE